MPKNEKEIGQYTLEISWDKICRGSQLIAEWIVDTMGDNTVIYGIPRGGLPVAVNIVHQIENMDKNARFVASLDHLLPGEWHRLIIVDEICDDGDTLTSVSRRFPEARTVVVFRREASKFEPDYAAFTICSNDWLEFPWE